MWDNWFKNIEEIYTYKYLKKEVSKFQKRVCKFWEDAYNDLIKRSKDKDE